MIFIDRRVLSLSFARSASSFANSFLLIILPLYIGSTLVSLNKLQQVSLLGFQPQQEFYIGLILSILGIVSGITQPAIGYISDSLQKRKLFIIIGISVLAVSTFGYLLASNYSVLFVLRAIQGIGIGMTVPVSTALITEYSYQADEPNAGENLGYFNTFRLLGFGSGPIVAGSIYQYGPYTTHIGTVTGIDAALLVSCVFSLLALSIVFLFIEDTDNTPDQTTTTNTSLVSELQYILSPRSPITSTSINPVLILGGATFILASCIALFATLETPINTRLEQTSVIFSIQFSLGIFGNVVFQIPAGKLSDNIGRKPVLLVGFALLVPIMFAHGFVSTSNQMFIVRFLLGTSVALFFPASLALAGEISPMKSGLILSVLTSAFSFGVAAGPLLAGLLYNIGSYTTPFYTMGTVSLIVCIGLFGWYVSDTQL